MPPLPQASAERIQQCFAVPHGNTNTASYPRFCSMLKSAKLLPCQILDVLSQVAAFADYSPSSGGSSGGGGGGATADSPKEQKPSEPAADPESNEANPGSGGAADSGGGGGGGDWPPHSVMGLPSLSPTMSQGMSTIE